MPFRRRMGGFRRFAPRAVSNTLKREVNAVQGVLAVTNTFHDIAIAVSNPTSIVPNNVHNGCKIFRVWVEFWYYGLSAGNTNDIFDCYIWKNTGANLTPPNPGTVGTSNEKTWVFKEWKGLAGNKGLGGTPYAFRGWIKIPKKMQRMATDDKLQLVVRSPTTGNWCTKSIVKEHF